MELIKEKIMKAIIIALTVLGFTGMTFADETVKEKAQAVGQDIKRDAKKGAHRVEEAVCMAGDVECAAKKAQHRVEEGADYTKDKAKEIKNDVDSDKK
jgi:hypothetical protein